MAKKTNKLKVNGNPSVRSIVFDIQISESDKILDRVKTKKKGLNSILEKWLLIPLITYTSAFIILGSGVFA